MYLFLLRMEVDYLHYFIILFSSFHTKGFLQLFDMLLQRLHLLCLILVLLMKCRNFLQ